MRNAGVATRRGSVPEVIDDGRTGIIVDDDRQLATRSSAPMRSTRMELRRAAEERFSKERMVADYVAAYEQAVARG